MVSRSEGAHKIRQRYPDRIPVIVSRDTKCTNVPELDRTKFLVPDGFAFSQFMYVVRKRLELPPEKAIFMFVGNSVLPPTSASLQTLYTRYKNADGFLYVTYCGENVFG